MTAMNEQLVQGLVIAQGLLLKALATTHPMPEELRRSFVRDLNKLLPSLPGEMAAAVTFQADRVLGWVPKADPGPRLRPN